MSISILGLLTPTAENVNILQNILQTVVEHNIMTKTFNKTICVVFVAGVILIRMFRIYVQTQTMGLRTLTVISVKIMLMEMHITMESIMENVKTTMILETLSLQKCVVIVVAA